MPLHASGTHFGETDISMCAVKIRWLLVASQSRVDQLAQILQSHDLAIRLGCQLTRLTKRTSQDDQMKFEQVSAHGVLHCLHDCQVCLVHDMSLFPKIDRGFWHPHAYLTAPTTVDMLLLPSSFHQLLEKKQATVN